MDEPFFGGQAISERSLTLRTGLAAGVPLSGGHRRDADRLGTGLATALTGWGGCAGWWVAELQFLRGTTSCRTNI